MNFPDPIINDYAEKMSSPESAVQMALNRETHQKVLYPQMLSGHIQGRILAMFSKMIKPKIVLEIGTYTGYSALCLAEGLAPGGKLITLDIDPELQEMAEIYFKKAQMTDQIEMRIGNAMDLIDQLDPENETPLDLVFIDADKGNYLSYYQKVMPLVRSGGFILADNVLWSGRVLDPDVNDKETISLLNFSKFVAADPVVEQVLLPVRDGIMVVRKL